MGKFGTGIGAAFVCNCAIIGVIMKVFQAGVGFAPVVLAGR